MVFVSCEPRTGKDTFPVYEGTDLGVNWAPEQTSFRIWAPTARQVMLRIYDQGQDGELLSSHEMKKDRKGTWTLE